MPQREFEKQAALLMENLARSRQIVGKSKILLEDLDSLTILSIQNRVQRAERVRRPTSRLRKKSLPC